MQDGGREPLRAHCWSMKSQAGRGNLQPGAHGGRGQGGLGFRLASNGEPRKVLGRHLAVLVGPHSSSGRNVAPGPRAASFAIVTSASNWDVSKGRQVSTHRLF